MAVLLPPTTGFAKPKPRLFFGGGRRACCSIAARASSEDGGGAAPPIDPDWRSFRAQLYFNVLYDAKSSVLANPGVSVKKVGDKWAHLLVKPERGCLLIATDKLDGSHIFERTVILLLSLGVWQLGPIGVILNRPSLMSIKEASETIFADDADIAAAFAGRPLFFGGPLEECFFILGPRPASAAAGGSGGDVVARTGLFEEVRKPCDTDDAMCHAAHSGCRRATRGVPVRPTHKACVGTNKRAGQAQHSVQASGGFVHRSAAGIVRG